MATKLERTVIVPDTMYVKIRRLAENEQTNIPFVTRQLLVTALANEKNRPDWFYEMQREIIGLRNDVLIAQRKKELQERSGEQLLIELQKQIAELKEALVVAPEKARVDLENEKKLELMLWPEEVEEEEEVTEGERVQAAELVQVQEIVSIGQPAKDKVLRPFFGKLSAMFSSVLS